MKNFKMKIKNIITIFLAFIVLNAWSQKEMKTGVITLEISDVSSKDEESNQMLQMMKGTQTIVAFSGDQSYLSMDIMGGLINVKNYTTANETNMFMDMMGQKIWVQTPVINTEKAMSDDFTVEIDKNNKKKIAGYDCSYVTIKNKTNPDLIINAYVTDAIKSRVNIIQGFEKVDFGGFPLEYTIDSGIKITMTAVDIKDTVDSEIFKSNSEGYTKMTKEELIEQLGPMSGMLGF
jgi:hypothetical protein